MAFEPMVGATKYKRATRTVNPHNNRMVSGQAFSSQYYDRRLRYSIMSKSLSILRILILLTLIHHIGACTGDVDIRQQKITEDRWLEKNYPDKPYASPEQAALPTEYYNDVIAGNVVVGMSLLETRVATKTDPHGSHKYPTFHWCDGLSVNACHDNCGICAAVLLTDKTQYYLKGKGNNPTVVQQRPRQQEDTAHYFASKSYSVINAIFLNKIVTGMDVTDFARIRLLPTAKQQYYCNNRRIYNNCLGDCGDCIIKVLTPRGDKVHVQTVHFKGHMDFKTIVNVTESTQASMSSITP